MAYEFKPTPELIWALIVTVTTALSQFILTSAQPTDWRVWGIGLAAAGARALVGFIVSKMGAGA